MEPKDKPSFFDQVHTLKLIKPKQWVLLVDSKRDVSATLVCRTPDQFLMTKDIISKFQIVIFANNLKQAPGGAKLLKTMLDEWGTRPREVWTICSDMYVKKAMHQSLISKGYSKSPQKIRYAGQEFNRYY